MSTLLTPKGNSIADLLGTTPVATVQYHTCTGLRQIETYTEAGVADITVEALRRQNLARTTSRRGRQLPVGVQLTLHTTGETATAIPAPQGSKAPFVLNEPVMARA